LADAKSGRTWLTWQVSCADAGKWLMQWNRRSRGWLGVLGLPIGLTIGLGGCRVFDRPVGFSPSKVLELSPSVPPPAPKLAARSGQPMRCSTQGKPNFLVFGGGGASSYNEIAIEKNVLYFQRTLKTLGLSNGATSGTSATTGPQIYFANGNDGQKTVRFIDPKTDRELFKAPEIKGLLGPATWPNLQAALAQVARSKTPKQPLFFYFTGHGSRNHQNVNNNAMILWDEQDVSVQDFASQLDRLPPQTPIVTVMVQCFSGAFANMIYEKGDPQRPVALQTRCGFFATIKQRPSGCTPSVDEADYEDYSSSFFAGLSGVNRVGQRVASADYDQDGRVSFREAHAFAKIDEQAADLPLSTSESWLREGMPDRAVAATMARPIAAVLQTARPEQRYVVETLGQPFGFDQGRSFTDNVKTLPRAKQVGELAKTNLTRLQLELINIAAEQAIRQGGDPTAIAILDRLLECENGSWQSRDQSRDDRPLDSPPVKPVKS
jgi:Caspase domain